MKVFVAAILVLAGCGSKEPSLCGQSIAYSVEWHPFDGGVLPDCMTVCRPEGQRCQECVLTGCFWYGIPDGGSDSVPGLCQFMFICP
jgi:hypothetical protein